MTLISFKLNSIHCVLVVLLLLLPLVFSAASAEETPSTSFVEEFNGETLDPAKWVVAENTNMSGYPAYGGSVQVSDRQLFLSSKGSSFPFIYSAVNPFPTEGDFTVEFAVTYTCVADSGCGIMLSDGFPTLDTIWHSRVFTLWGADEGPDKAVIYIELFNSLVYKMTVPGFKPSSSQHIYRVAYENGIYSIYVDNARVATAESQERPTMIVIGNPSNPEVPQSPQIVHDWGNWGWSSFKVAFIKVSAGLPESETSSAFISISTESFSTQTGSAVNVVGTLCSSNSAPLQNKLVVLSYTFAGADSWIPVSSSLTNEDGKYSVQWINTASGTFTLKAEWSGDGASTGASNTTTLSFLPIQRNQILFVESNSTISALAFNSTSSEIAFTATGPSETTGYVIVTVAKTAVQNSNEFKVFLDGNQLNCTVTSTADSWLIEFNYSHSTHHVSMYMGTSVSQTTPFGVDNGVLLAVVATTVAGAAVVLLSIRKMGKNAHVSAKKEGIGQR